MLVLKDCLHRLGIDDKNLHQQLDLNIQSSKTNKKVTLVVVFTSAVVDIASFLLEPVVVGEVMVVAFSVVNCEGDNGGDSNIGIGVGVVEVEQQSSGERRQ
ncbi:hypothetical protein C5167_030895 [Papaver somniferum]|nr:hypothetical protein C5167_030895 [Papaver somniferum]